jgi:hypothetical protein
VLLVLRIVSKPNDYKDFQKMVEQCIWNNCVLGSGAAPKNAINNCELHYSTICQSQVKKLFGGKQPLWFSQYKFW